MTSWRCTVGRSADGAPVIYRVVDGNPTDRWDRLTKTWLPIEENNE